jgi:hypothetical protein
MYSYLTGPRFKHRVECIAEKFTELRKDLDGERKWMTMQSAKRDRELTTVLEAVQHKSSNMLDNLFRMSEISGGRGRDRTYDQSIKSRTPKMYIAQCSCG